MKKHYYDASSLERVLLSFELRYEMTSAEFYAAHIADDGLDMVSGFHRNVWASFYRDVVRLRGDPDDFADKAAQLLELA